MLYKSCRVKGCYNKTTHPGSAFKFFPFPKIPELRLQWVEAIGLDPSLPLTRHASVCSDHFHPKYIELYGTVWKLRRLAVPHQYLNGERRCSVDRCRNSQEKDGLYKFYTFPTAFKSIEAQWKAFTKRTNFEPSLSSFICSAHFSIHQYNEDHLKWDAVPDVVGFEEDEEEDQEESIDENVNQIEKFTENGGSSITMDVNDRIWLVDSIEEVGTDGVSPSGNQENSEKPILISTNLSIPNASDQQPSLRLKNIQYRCKIRTLQQKVRRQTKQIQSMKTLVYVLKNRLKHCKCDLDDLLTS